MNSSKDNKHGYKKEKRKVSHGISRGARKLAPDTTVIKSKRKGDDYVFWFFKSIYGLIGIKKVWGKSLLSYQLPSI